MFTQIIEKEIKNVKFEIEDLEIIIEDEELPDDLSSPIDNLVVAEPWE